MKVKVNCGNFKREYSKARIVRLYRELEDYTSCLKHLVDGVPLSEVAREYDISESALIAFIDKSMKEDITGISQVKNKSARCYAKKVWPESLYCKVFNTTYYNNIPADAEETIDFLLEDVGFRNRDIFMRHFKGGESLASIARDLGLTLERIRQITIKIISNLQSPNHSRCLQNGLLACQMEDELNAENRRNLRENASEDTPDEEALTLEGTVESRRIRNETFENLHITDMGLTARAVNSFRAHGIVNGKQLLELTETEVRRIKNIGRGEFERIEAVLENWGVRLAKRNTSKKGVGEKNERIDEGLL